MSNSNHDNGHTSGQTRCELHRLERNNYFTGKLLTPRDFITEQAYHAGTQRTTARSVLGTGSVCGLGVEPTLYLDEEPERLDVTVTPGLAIDGCGRLAVVDEAVVEPFTLPVTADGEEVNDISVYVEWRECATESVPRTGIENACETECTPNRLVEYGEVTVVPGPPDATGAGVGEIDFPDRETVLGIRRSGSDDVGVALDAVPVVLPPTDDAQITGATTAATGADVSVDLALPDGETVELSADAAADGTFAVTVDASEYEASTRFTVTVSVGGAVLEVPGVVGNQTEEPFVDDPTVLFDAAQSYYAANRGACSFAEGPVLVGTLHRSEGQPWDLAVFERGPIVYGNELLYAAVASHAADFDNPHQVSLELDTVEVVDEDGGDGDTDTDTDGGTVLLVSGETYTQGTVLEASVGGLDVGQYQLRTVRSNRPGALVGPLALGQDGDTLRIETDDLEGSYVVTADGAGLIVVFDADDDARITDDLEETPDALFTIESAVTEPPEPVETSRTRLSVPGFDGPGGDVFFTSTDGSVNITPHLGERTVDFAASGGAGLTAEQREYVRERSLLNAAESFDSLGLDAAFVADMENVTDAQRQVVQQLLVPILFIRQELIAALNADDYVDPATFLSVFTRPIVIGGDISQTTLVELETLLGSNLETALGQTPPGLQVYIDATGLLETAVAATEGSDEARAIAVAVAQDRVAEAAKILLISVLLAAVDTSPEFGVATRPAVSTGRRVAASGRVSTAYVEAADAMDTMPDLAGVTRDEAELRLAIRGYEPEVALRSVDDAAGLAGIGVNDVEGQTPAPGERIQPGTQPRLEVVETPDTRSVDGIGDEFAGRLEGAGIRTVYDVSTAPVETLVEATGASERTAREWKADANLLKNGYRLTRTEGIDAEIASALARGVGVTSEVELATADGEAVVAALETAREAGRIPQSSFERAGSVDWTIAVDATRERVDPERTLGRTLGGNLLRGGGFRPR